MKEGNKSVDDASLVSPLEAGRLPATWHFEKGSTQHRPSLPAGAGRLPLPKPSDSWLGLRSLFPSTMFTGSLILYCTYGFDFFFSGFEPENKMESVTNLTPGFAGSAKLCKGRLTPG